MPDVAQVMETLQHLVVAINPYNLFLLAFIEAIFFPIPPDTVLMPLALMNPLLAPWFAVIAAVGSTAGAMVGYGLGLRGGRPALERLASDRWIQRVEDMFHRYDAWAVGVAGFTPIPYKVVAVAAGVFRIHFRRFVVISLISRGARFLLVALLIMYFGEEIVAFLMQNFGFLTLGIFIAVFLAYLAARSWRRRTA